MKECKIVDSSGNLFIADSGNNRIRTVDSINLIIETTAGNGDADFSGDGGSAKNASLSFPQGVIVDNSSNIFASDSENNRIRRVDSRTGQIETFAGVDPAVFLPNEEPTASTRLPVSYTHLRAHET